MRFHPLQKVMSFDAKAAVIQSLLQRIDCKSRSEGNI